MLMRYEAYSFPFNILPLGASNTVTPASDVDGFAAPAPCSRAEDEKQLERDGDTDCRHSVFPALDGCEEV